MKNLITLNQEIIFPESVKKFLQFLLLENELGIQDLDENHLKEKINKFVTENLDFNGDNIKVYSLKLYQFPNNFDEKKKNKFLYSLIHAVGFACKCVMERDGIEDDHNEILFQRNVNPPLEAYRFKKYTARYSNNSYALLFDK